MSTIVTNVKKIDNNTTLYIVATTTTFCLLNKITRCTRIIQYIPVRMECEEAARDAAQAQTTTIASNGDGNAFPSMPGFPGIECLFPAKAVITTASGEILISYVYVQQMQWLKMVIRNNTDEPVCVWYNFHGSWFINSAVLTTDGNAVGTTTHPIPIAPPAFSGDSVPSLEQNILRPLPMSPPPVPYASHEYGHDAADHEMHYHHEQYNAHYGSQNGQTHCTSDAFLTQQQYEYEGQGAGKGMNNMLDEDQQEELERLQQRTEMQKQHQHQQQHHQQNQQESQQQQQTHSQEQQQPEQQQQQPPLEQQQQQPPLEQQQQPEQQQPEQQQQQ